MDYDNVNNTETLWTLPAHCESQQCGAFMMTSSNGIISRVTGHMCREFTGHRWIPRTKASDAPEPTVEQTMETLVIWDAIALIMTAL